MKERILAVDDEAGALKNLLLCIRECLPEAETASFRRASDAFDYIQENPVRIAFLDIDMPGSSGLQIAEKLEELNPSVNIIFTTGHEEYALDAIRLRSSGYLLKPIITEDVQNELDHLRYQSADKAGNDRKRARAVTFGYFDLFVENRPISFQWAKEKELLAFLIDCRGASVSRKEIAAVLFEDRDYSRSTQSYLTKLFVHLKETLDKYGLSGLLLADHNSYALDVTLIACDAYDFLDGLPGAETAWHGEYMKQYSWSEDRLSAFDRG